MININRKQLFFALLLLKKSERVTHFLRSHFLLDVANILQLVDPTTALLVRLQQMSNENSWRAR